MTTKVKCMTEYVGRKYNYLVITSIFRGKTYSDGRFKWMANCLCDCGNKIETYIESLTSSKRKSCGCHRKKHKNSAIPFAYREYKYSASKRGYDFELSIEQFKSITGQNCYYCGEPPMRKTIVKNDIYIHNGIDRKDNSIGYQHSNCLPCCTFCNLAKMDRSYDDFMIWIKRIASYYEEVVE